MREVRRTGHAWRHAIGRAAAFVALVALALPALAAPTPPLAAQETGGTVRGTVRDSSTSLAIAAAQVVVVGSTRGAVTNDAGQFTLRGVPAGAVTVRVQRIGFAPADRRVIVAAGDTAVADIALRPIAVRLSEVVSLGYGTSSRQDVSSAISSVSAEEIAGTPVAGLDAAIQGKMPGVQVVQNAGNPGNGISVRVRGPASLNAGNQPLYVVDGVPILQENFTQLGLGGQDITAVTGLNPGEIATIDVLKDAAAAAIYGSRASNGVVLVTTKRGRSGTSRISFNSYLGTQEATRRLSLLNAQQYVEIFNESAKNDGYDPEDYDFTPGKDDSASFNWQNAVFRNAPIRDFQLGVSGGSDRVQYYVSGSAFDQEGVVIGSGYQRQAARVNLDFGASDKLFLRSSIGLTREDNDRIEGDGSLDGIVTNAIGMQPMRPIRGASSGFGGSREGLRYSNPVALASLNSTNLRTLRALGNVEARFLFTDRVWLSGLVGMDVLSLDETQWQSPLVDRTYAASANGVGKTDHTTANKYLLQSFLTVEPIRRETSRLSLVGGASVEYNHSDLNFIRGEGFTSGFTKYVRNAANVTSYDGSATEHNIVSFFSRANYSLRDRYLFSASFRADGSSRFGKENRYGYFPAASVGWVVSDEGFARALGRVATLKLRASYGVTGNQGIGDFAALSLASGAPYSGTPGIAPSTLGNASLRWENTREVDGGVDLFFFGGRAGVVADFYRRKTSDLLVQRPIPLLSGFSTVWDNVGSIENRGVDLGFQTVNLRADSPRELGWTTDLNITWNRNRVTSLYGGQQFTTGINGRETSIVREDEPLGAFYMYQFDGVDPQTGNAIIRDIDGDGKTTAADRMVVGSPHPKYFGGLTNTFSFRSFDVRAFAQFSKGNGIFNMMRIFTDDGACSYDNKTSNVLRRWQKPGDVTDMPRMSYDCKSGANLISSRFIEDGSYLRIGEVTLGYRLPARWSAALRMESARLYVSGRNLHTFTNYSGYNPDVNSAGSDANVVMGTDYYAYPIPRTYTIGISAGW
ncbi:MAG: SusC/RagA family TonB-linked outer membrane protein [Gemmatimonadaceae bacterium]